MIKKYFVVFITLLGLSYFTSQEASASTTLSNEELLSKVKIYDGDDNLIPYTLEELSEIITFETESPELQQDNLITPFAVQRTYTSPSFIFSNYTDLKGGDLFKDPLDIRITPKGEAKDFTLSVLNTNGISVQNIRIDGGWYGTAHYAVNKTGNYGFRFTNRAISQNSMDWVSVIYHY